MRHGDDLADHQQGGNHARGRRLIYFEMVAQILLRRVQVVLLDGLELLLRHRRDVLARLQQHIVEMGEILEDQVRLPPFCLQAVAQRLQLRADVVADDAADIGRGMAEVIRQLVDLEIPQTDVPGVDEMAVVEMRERRGDRTDGEQIRRTLRDLVEEFRAAHERRRAQKVNLARAQPGHCESCAHLDLFGEIARRDIVDELLTGPEVVAFHAVVFEHLLEPLEGEDDFPQLALVDL